jgi:RNA polymerase sigma factor (sigma-70 family)
METDRKPSLRAEEDRRLIESAIAGDRTAFDRLMTKYRKSVYYVIFKMIRNPEDAEDLTQDTFVKAYGSMTRFDPKFAFSTWLFKIATNNCIDFIRKRKMQLLSINDGAGSEDGTAFYLQIVDPALIPYDQILRHQRKEYLLMAIEQLPARYQELIQLRYFQELSYEEVATTLNIPLGTVKAQLHRSRELLNEVLSSILHNL